jgi:preprotein translocase subunit YajC
MNSSFLLSLPGGGEWMVLIVFFLFIIVSPVLAIMYYMEAKKLRKENKELLNKLLERK